MTAVFDEAGLRHWLVDYLVANIGCSPDDVDRDASFNDLGVASRDAVVLSGELSELLGRPVSPVDFWQHPTINALVGFLNGAEPECVSQVVAGGDGGLMDEPIAVIGLGCRFPGGIQGPESLWQLLFEGRSAVGEVPPDRWRPFDDGSPEVAATLSRTTRWGSFLSDIDAFDAQSDRTNPVQAVLWGLGRTLALEHPELWGTVLDVDESVPVELAARYVLAEAHSGDGEDQVVYRAGVRHVPRLRTVPAPSTPPGELDKDSSHLVIGATGNIGPHLIRQLADMGAATIVAVSRNPGSRLQDLARDLSVQGTELTTVAADASDEATMSALFDRFGTDLPPLGGIYVAAFGGGPVTLRDMTDDDVAAMFAPKLDVVSLLHRLSLKQPVTQFVLFSSISGLLGSRWLGHYAATTTILDAFAYARRAAGLPATAINWGLWKSLASNQNDEQLRVALESGLEPMPDEVAIQALRSVTGPDVPARCTIVAADWGRLATAYRTRATPHIVDDLVPVENDENAGTAAMPTTDFREALGNCEPTRRRELLADHVAEIVAGVMGLESPQSLDPSTGFFHFGMDSLMTVTLQRALTDRLGLPIPASAIFNYPTIETLTEYLATNLPEFTEAADQPSEVAYADLTESELLQQLSDRLSGAR